MGRIGRPLSACLSPCLSFSALPTCVNNSRLERHEERVAKGRKVDSDEGHRQEELRQLDLGESPLRDQCDRVAAARLVDHCTDEKRAHNLEPGARRWMQRLSLLLTVNADDENCCGRQGNGNQVHHAIENDLLGLLQRRDAHRARCERYVQERVERSASLTELLATACLESRHLHFDVGRSRHGRRRADGEARRRRKGGGGRDERKGEG